MRLIRQIPEAHKKDKTMNTIIGADAAKLAGLQIDLLQKMRQGQITVEQLAWFVGLGKVRRDILDYPIPSSWREENGIIYFSVESDGTKGETWIRRLEGNGFRVGKLAQQMLRSPDFKPTYGITTEVAVLRGAFFEDSDRNTANIRAEAALRKLEKPNAEVACLIRDKFMDDTEIKAMGLLWIVTMHEPIKDCDGDSHLLDVRQNDDGRWLDSVNDGPDGRWARDHGFAFAVSPQY